MNPSFTIIVPTRNRPHLLEQCLAALARQDYPREQFRVIVVDDGSTPSVASIVEPFAANLQVRCLRTEGVGPARARNLALAQADGDFVVFTDDDCQPVSTWLEAYRGAALRYPGAGLGGCIVDAPANNIYGRTSQILVTYLYVYNETTDALRFFCSNNFAFPRAELQALGGFDETFPLAAGEDRYLCARWLRSAPMHYVPGAVIQHRQFFGLQGFLRQQFRYGRGAFQFWQRRSADDGAVNKVQPFRFYWDMLRFPFGREPFFRAIGMSFLLVVSQVAGFLGYRAELRDSKSTPTAQTQAQHKGVR